MPFIWVNESNKKGLALKKFYYTPISKQFLFCRPVLYDLFIIDVKSKCTGKMLSWVGFVLKKNIN